MKLSKQVLLNKLNKLDKREAAFLIAIFPIPGISIFYVLYFGARPLVIHIKKKRKAKHTVSEQE